MAERKREFKPFYPDVLGIVTGGTRIHMGDLQCAVGVFPRQIFVNQPAETVIVLQNMIDKEIQVKVAVRLPNEDRKGSPAVFDAARNQVTQNLKPGEVGVLRMPFVARLPTKPGKGFPVRVAIRFRTPPSAETIRPPSGGAPPSVLTISPFKLQVLRDVAFNAHIWNDSAEIITSYFEIAPRRLPRAPELPDASFETLWARENMSQEISKALAYADDARLLAQAKSQHGSSYDSFRTVIEDRFAERDWPLHPGEAMAIAKMMAYTLDDAPGLEPDVEIEETRWFIGLCQVLASDPELRHMNRHELIATYLFSEVLYESILMGFKVLESKVRENLGKREERLDYANQVMAWLGGRGQGDLNYIYLPLVLGGLSISRIVRAGIRENPWDVVDGLEEALQGRIRLADDSSVVVFEMLRTLLNRQAAMLRSQRIERRK